MYFQQGTLEIVALDFDGRILMIFNNNFFQYFFSKKKNLSQIKKKRALKIVVWIALLFMETTMTINKLFFIEITLKLQFVRFAIYRDSEVVDKLALIHYLSVTVFRQLLLLKLLYFVLETIIITKYSNPQMLQKIKMTNTCLYRILPSPSGSQTTNKHT